MQELKSSYRTLTPKNFLDALFVFDYSCAFSHDQPRSVRGDECHLLPESKGIYFLATREWNFDDVTFGHDWTLQYIGCTTNLKFRFCDSLERVGLVGDIDNKKDKEYWSGKQPECDGVFYAPYLDRHCLYSDSEKYLFRHHAVNRFMRTCVSEFEWVTDLFVFYIQTPEISDKQLQECEKVALGIFKPPHNRNGKKWLNHYLSDNKNKGEHPLFYLGNMVVDV